MTMRPASPASTNAHGIESPHLRLVGLRRDQVARLAIGRWRPGERVGRPQPLSAGRAWLADRRAECRRRRVDVADDTARRHVLAIANAGSIVAYGGGRQAQNIEIRERGDARSVHADPGIVEDDRAHPDLGGHIAGVHRAMRAGDDDLIAMLVTGAGDARKGEGRRDVHGRPG